MKTRILIILALFVICLLPPAATSGAAEKQVATPRAVDKLAVSAAIEKVFLGKSFQLLPAFNGASQLYVHSGDSDYLLRHKLSGVFPAPMLLEDVTITRVRRDTEREVLSSSSKMDGKRLVLSENVKTYSYWVFTLKHTHLGKGEFRVARAGGEPIETAAELQQVLGYVLQGEGLARPSRIRAVRGARLFHFACSGHAPEAGELSEFSTPQEAIAAGFKACPLCFSGRIRLANMDDELRLGQETEASLRHYYRPSADATVQARVERIGRKILAAWPTRLIGYDYRFGVLENSEFNAVACAGGYIFVYSGLLDVMESDEELEAVLAHEIAHVEQRHGIHELMLARRQASTAAAIGAIVTGAGAIAAATANNRATILATAAAAANIGTLIYTLGAQVAETGYSREHELEADICALIYLQKAKVDRSHLLSVLKKVRTSSDLENPTATSEENGSGRHPAPKTRLQLAATIQIERWPEPVVFDAFNKDQELLYSLSLLGTCHYKLRDGSTQTRVLVDVITTSGLEEARTVDELSVAFAEGPTTFRFEGGYDLHPMDRLGMAFTAKGEVTLTSAVPGKPRLIGINSATVVRRQGTSTEGKAGRQGPN